jgi:transcriptional regulator with XRE-family HTH domain
MRERQTSADFRAHELGRFLMARRADLTPEDVGLPSGPRRRRGLRREEVAMLAGVGASWYQWIEQGRAKNVSRQVLEAISHALRLDSAQRRYLLELAGMADGASAAFPPDASLADRIVEAYSPHPAFVLDTYMNVVSVNHAAIALFGERLEGGNYLRLLFTESSFLRLFTDWERSAAEAIARFRARTTGLINDPALCELATELKDRSEEFARLWESRGVLDGPSAPLEMRHRELGYVCFTPVSLDFTGPGGCRLMLLVPDDATRAKLTAEDPYQDQARRSLGAVEVGREPPVRAPSAGRSLRG